MPWLDFFWTNNAIEKISQHGLTVEDVEFVIQNPSYIRRSRSSERQIAFGYSESGDWIACPFDLIDEVTAMPVTAFRPTKGE